MMKRILSLDGGGIRGLLSIAVVKRIEAILRETHGDDQLVLADVFDLFAGTSTGAIIAAGLCWGMSAGEIEKLYIEHGAELFRKTPWYRRLHSKYQAESIGAYFRGLFCEEDGTAAKLGTKKLRKLLVVVMRNASTGSPWPVSNHAGAMFNDASRADCNLAVPLWQLLRASTAAPSFFEPQEIALGGEKHLFVDGGITPFNNPALLAVLMATLPAYRIEWPTGRQRIHVVSIGTGSMRFKLPRKIARKINLIDHLGYVIPGLMQSVAGEQDMLCRILGDCVHGEALDTELGALTSPTLLSGAEQKFTYARYDMQLDDPRLGRLTKRQTALDNLAMIPVLCELGATYASAHVHVEHLWPREMRA
ncbi:MAG: patatin [Planctomycetes bacterium]|nr:patatin [Planctomycetota bacterium]